jgi:hypothetical protein
VACARSAISRLGWLRVYRWSRSRGYMFGVKGAYTFKEVLGKDIWMVFRPLRVRQDTLLSTLRLLCGDIEFTRYQHNGSSF